MKALPLKQEIIYGPVLSRRLKRSLGINLFSKNTKICSFNCIYCHYGETKLHLTDPFQISSEFVYPRSQVLSSLEKVLQQEPEIDYITFSGNGEPCLHPEFKEIVHQVQELRNKYLPKVKIALLSNSSLIGYKHIQESLSWIDVKIMKLDVGSSKMFKQINQPGNGISFENILEALQSLREVIIQTVFIQGKIANDSEEEISHWTELIKRISPKKVQIYSIDRPTIYSDLKKVVPARLWKIAAETTKKTGIKVEAYYKRQ
jgi:wyosine [tRNA(Phe)-imidazoG37] synthetase (radical SAM superfamily)